MPAPSASPAPQPPSAERDKVAVLPIEDDELFRSERAELRAELARALTTLVTTADVLPLGEVDAKLAAGARCAYPSTPRTRRATDAGWLATSLLHVSGFEDKPEELWVQLSGWNDVRTTLTGQWNPKLDGVNRYRSAFASLVLQPEPPGLLGGLGMRGSRANQVTVGPLTLCETQDFASCAPESRGFSDVGEQLAPCFAGADQDDRELLFEGNSRCELANLEDPNGPGGRLETCLCSAIATSQGVRAKPGRRVLSLHYEAPDLQGKPRPEVRAVDVSGNLFAEKDWSSLARQEGGKTTYASVQRLVVDNLDALRAPLSRCAGGAGSVVVGELAVNGDGTIASARVMAGAGTAAEGSCIEKALMRGALSCTNDGKPATLRIAITWPK